MKEMNPGATGIISSPCSFRGKMITRYMPELPRDVSSKAYEDMDPEAMLAYADELSEYIDEVSRPGTLEAAIEWLRYWAGMGVSMIAWD